MITLVLSGDFAQSLCLTSFFSADFHLFLTFSRFGSPPASAAAVAALPDIKLDAESLGQTRDASSRRRVVDVCAVAAVRFYLRGSRCVRIVLPFLPPRPRFCPSFLYSRQSQRRLFGLSGQLRGRRRRHPAALSTHLPQRSAGPDTRTAATQQRSRQMQPGSNSHLVSHVFCRCLVALLCFAQTACCRG